MKLFRFFLVLVMFSAYTVLAADKPASQPATPAQILPKDFGGWQISGSIQKSTDPAVADPVNAIVLKEYGLTGFESANYARDDGRKLKIKVAQFGDASGAYGAFTYYKMPQMLVEKIGDQAASLNERVLFYRGNFLVDATFQALSAMSAAELRELAAVLPLGPGNTQNLPGLPAYLPKESYVKNSAKYVLGPETLRKVSSPIPADLVDFNAGAEVVLGNYTTSGGEATLTLISYPTPQIAGDHLRKLAATTGANSDGVSPAQANGGPFFEKRTGPIVVVASGPLSQSEGKSLLASINYDANVTWNENTHFTRRDNIGVLIVNIIYLCGIIIALALVAGVAFGGLRVLSRKLFPGRARVADEEIAFISLHLTEEVVPAPAQDVNSSIKTA